MVLTILKNIKGKDDTPYEMENKHMFETTNQYINIYIISNFFCWSNPHLLLIQAPWSHYSATAIWRLGSWIPPRSDARNPQEPPDVKMSLWYDVVRLWWSLHHRKWMWMIYIYVNMYNYISIIIHIIPYIYISQIHKSLIVAIDVRHSRGFDVVL